MGHLAKQDDLQTKMSFKKLFLELFFFTLEMRCEPRCLESHAKVEKYFANYIFYTEARTIEILNVFV